MKGILIQQKVFKAIDGKYADTVSDDKKLENDEYAYSSIILNLSDSVIRKVGKQESAKELWKKLEELYTETSLPISMANEKICDVYGYGDVCLIFENGFKLTLKNVRHVPDLAHNLISCSALEEEGLEGKWGKGVMKIMKGSLTVFKAERKRNLYICSVKSPSVPLSGKIPECVWTDSDVNLSSLRIFGCSAFALSHGDKLDPDPKNVFLLVILMVLKAIGSGLEANQKVEDYNIESTFNKVEEPIEDNQQGEENRVETETENENLETGDNLNHYLLARDRERREPRIPAKLRDFQLALNTKNLEEPTSYNEALKTPESENWLLAMKEEMKSLHDNKTWILVPKPKDTSIVDCKWIFKIKQEDNSSRFKARLVAKGFTQTEGVDYTEIFSPVVKYTTVRIILALVAHYDWELKQMDVKTAFLHGDLHEPTLWFY
ncbi:Retrovirus-related Pol polyprotein from transposon TNT 1-94 [Sesamum angolense]|uniref:Retrovirus-related Pol polyprotein from transposon TNT 1-94 n=1 Tax=Sesamum angolense TaxID=2727404 RepID=A0AAE1WUT9_9LAMI|nr:Retrovirus-related Pol polyprotein from transposon TNT 1-94 [Sesamum angolense]